MPDRMQMLAQYLAASEDVLLAYLFGSQAAGTARLSGEVMIMHEESAFICVNLRPLENMP
ncbi:MAG: hypothetical protein QXH03_05545 [Candidatus Bathyarchaeia archaeon]